MVADTDGNGIKDGDEPLYKQQNGLVAHYFFNESIEDQSGLGRKSNLIASSGYSTDRFGNERQALALTKNPATAFEVDVSDLNMNGGEDFTVSLWLLLNDGSHPDTTSHISIISTDTFKYPPFEGFQFSGGFYRTRHLIYSGVGGKYNNKNHNTSILWDFKIWRKFYLCLQRKCYQLLC